MLHDVLMTISRKVVEQEREGEPSTSTVYWAPSDAPIRKDMSNPRNAKVAAIRRYLENTVDCCRYLLLLHFDPVVANKLGRRDKTVCCHNCQSALRSCQ